MPSQSLTRWNDERIPALDESRMHMHRSAVLKEEEIRHSAESIMPTR